MTCYVQSCMWQKFAYPYIVEFGQHVVLQNRKMRLITGTEFPLCTCQARVQLFDLVWRSNRLPHWVVSLYTLYRKVVEFILEDNKGTISRGTARSMKNGTKWSTSWIDIKGAIQNNYHMSTWVTHNDNTNIHACDESTNIEIQSFLGPYKQQQHFLRGSLTDPGDWQGKVIVTQQRHLLMNATMQSKWFGLWSHSLCLCTISSSSNFVGGE